MTSLDVFVFIIGITENKKQDFTIFVTNQYHFVKPLRGKVLEGFLFATNIQVLTDYFGSYFSPLGLVYW